MHFYKTPQFIQYLMPGLVWKESTTNKEVFLTFDDGPVRGVTDWVLDTLNEFGAKATFFVVGENVQNNLELFKRVILEGHSIGNHTFNHQKAWVSPRNDFLKNIKDCEGILHGLSNEPLFRPPHGQLTYNLIRTLKKEYNIIMWDVLTGDYDSGINWEESLNKSFKHTSSGSIVVFHDSLKAEKKLKWVLPRYLELLEDQGYSFKRLRPLHAS